MACCIQTKLGHCASTTCILLKPNTNQRSTLLFYVQVGMSGVCYPDSLIASTPNLYYYAANNPSEATIAKRRSYANTISYLTPPAENAGLYKGLKVRSGAWARV